MEKGELLNATNGSGHGDNESENFDDEEHCKTLGGVSIKSNERQLQNKKTTLHTQQDKKRIANKWKKYQTHDGTKD